MFYTELCNVLLAVQQLSRLWMVQNLGALRKTLVLVKQQLFQNSDTDFHPKKKLNWFDRWFFPFPQMDTYPNDSQTDST